MGGMHPPRFKVGGGGWCVQSSPPPPGFSDEKKISAGNRDIWIFVGIFKPTSMSKYLKYHVPVLLECENAKIF